MFVLILEMKCKNRSLTSKLITMRTNYTIAKAAVFLLAVMLLATSCKKTVTPKVAIEESSVVVSYDRALMVAKVVSNGGGTITEYGFCYGKMNDIPDTLLCQGDGTSFSVELPDLSPSTEYTCMAFARNERGRGYSDLFRFTTMSAVDTIPLVDTYTVKDITYCSAVPSGQVLSNGGQEVMERGICYGTVPRPTIEGMHVALGSGAGPFECELTDLLPETRYYVRAYAVCTKGVYYGDQLAFDTKVLPLALPLESVHVIRPTKKCAKLEFQGYQLENRTVVSWNNLVIETHITLGLILTEELMLLPLILNMLEETPMEC